MQYASVVYSAYFVMVQYVLATVCWVGYRSNERLSQSDLIFTYHFSDTYRAVSALYVSASFLRCVSGQTDIQTRGWQYFVHLWRAK